MRDKKHSKEKRHSKEHHHHQLLLQQQQQHHHRSSDHRDRDRDRKVSRSSGGSTALLGSAATPTNTTGTTDRRVASSEHHRHDERNELPDRYHYRGPPPPSSSQLRFYGSGGDDERDMRYQKQYERSGGGGAISNYYYQQSQQQAAASQQYSNSRKAPYDYYGREPDGHAAEYGVGHHRHHHHGSNSDSQSQERSRKYNSGYELTKDVDNLEQDLRSRLLSKRHNFVNSFVVDEHADYEMPVIRSYESSSGRHKMSRHEKEQRERVHNSHREHRDKQRDKVIEVLDSPEVLYDSATAAAAVASDTDGMQHRRKHKRHKERANVVVQQPPAAPSTENHEKRKTPDDPELLARRAKILAAEHEKTKRRHELDARREMLRKERAGDGPPDALSPSAIAASMTAGLKVVKRKSKSGPNEDDGSYADGETMRKRKRLKKSKRSDGELDDDEHEEGEHVDNVDNDDDDDDDDDEEEDDDDELDSESDSESNSASNISSAEEGALSDANTANNYKAAKEPVFSKKVAKSKSKTKRHRDPDDLATSRDYDSDGDIRLPESPFSLGELSKSPKAKKRHPKKLAGKQHKHKHHHHHHHHHAQQPASEHTTENDAIHSVSEDSMQSHTSRSRSQTRSHSSRSRSPTHSPVSVSGSSSSSSQSRSATHSSRSRSRSESQSRSRSGNTETSSRSRSHSRSRSRSRTRSEERGMTTTTTTTTTTTIITTTTTTNTTTNSNSNRTEVPTPKEVNNAAGAAKPSLVVGGELQKATAGVAAASTSGTTSLDGSPMHDDKDLALPNYYPGIQGCRSVEEFQCLNRIEEGTYGVVYRAKDKRTNEIVALKRLKMEKEKEGFPITSLREINTLLKGQHPNIVTVREIVVGSNMDKIFIVMDYVEHDLKSLMETMKHRKQVFFPGEVKCLIQQLLRAVGHLHDNWILHRDLKTSNLLLSHKGILKVGDFGLAREYGSPLKKYTSLVVTLWYRAPELLLCSPEYSTGIDIWSVGCIFAEFLQMAPIFPGKTEIDQLNRIFKELGTPNEKVWPGYNDLPAVKNLISQNSHFADFPVSNLRKHFADRTTSTGISLLHGLLTYDPKQRLNAEAALKHDYFKELPLPIDPSMFPTWPAKSELGARKAMAASPKPPSGGSQFKQLGQDDVVAAATGGGGGGVGAGGTNAVGAPLKIVSGIITGNKKSAANTGFVLNAGIDQRQLAMGGGATAATGGGFKLKF